MDKYLCICGHGFENKKDADSHVLINKDLNIDIPHVILKKTWKGRFLYWFWNLDLPYILSYASGVIINSIVIIHLDLSIIESFVESFCLGILLIRLLE